MNGRRDTEFSHPNFIPLSKGIGRLGGVGDHTNKQTDKHANILFEGIQLDH